MRRRPWLLLIAASALMLVLLSTSMSAATAPIQVATQDPTPKVQQPKGAHSRRPPQVSAASAPSHDSCPVLYPAGHGLVNTGRKALVLYAFTSHPDLPERQVEVDNFQFFRGHGIMPPDTPTALFSSVDYVITTSKMDRSTPVGDHGVVQCASNANVKVFQAPSGPCDLCAYGRGIKALGGPEAVAKHYEYVFMFNSGVRGPLFTEAPAGPDDPPPVTWLDHAALGGESVYTGMLMTGTIGTATHRPYLTSFAFGFPTAVLMTMQPVLYAGCLEMTPTMPEQWEGLLTSFDADLHLDGDPKELIAKLKAILDNPSVLKSTPKGDRDAVARKIDEKVAAGVENHRAAAEKAYKILMAGTKNPPWSEKKRACVYRTEVQMLKTALGTKLPPEVGDSSSSSPLRRPRLTPHQKSLLSPVLSGYLHEGHYFGRSFFHNQTVVNMGHGMLLNEPGHLPMCALLFLKFGGMAWREKNINGLFALGMQMLTLAQAPQRITPPGINLAQVLQCPRQTAVEPLK